MLQVIPDESADEKVTVIIARMAAQEEGLVGFLTGSFKVIGMELFGKKRVIEPLINEKCR